MVLSRISTSGSFLSHGDIGTEHLHGVLFRGKGAGGADIPITLVFFSNPIIYLLGKHGWERSWFRLGFAKYLSFAFLSIYLSGGERG